MATSIQGERVVPQSNNRRRGWVIASEDGTEIERPTSFDARKSAAAWNKGKGPSQASIPSRASSLASTPAPTPMLPSEPFQQADEPSASGPSTSEVITLPVPPPRIPSSSMSHSRDATSSTTSEAESSTGRRRPSPPLLVPPKQTFKKVPSKRVLPPSALSDHEKFMAAAYKGAGSSASSSSAGTSGSRSPFANAALRSDLAKLAASRRANSSSSSSTATTSTSASVSQSATASATSAVSATPTSNQLKGKAKQISQSPLQSDPEGFFSSGGKVKQMANTYDNTHSRQQSGDPQSSADASASSQQRSSDFTQHKQSLLLSQVHPLPALSEKSANSDIEDVPSSASDVMSDNEAAISAAAAKTVKRRESLQIELPPPPPQFKDRYPTILVDSTHASDSEASGTSNAGPRRRRRRSTASMSNKLGTDAEDDDDDEYAGDDSSWPSTPSTTPLETYFIAADAKPKPAKRTMQTTMEIVAAESSALGMGRPMVVVTSPSTASEVSSDRRSSSGSGSTSDRTYSSSPPAVASVAPPPALSKIEEHPSAKSDAAEASTAGPPKRSLSFEVPVMNRFRASEESLPIGGAVRSPSRAMAFLAKMNPSRSANRSSVDLVSTTRTDASSGTVQAAKRMSLDDQRRTSAEQRRSVELRPILLNAASRPPPRPVAIEAASSTTTSQQERRRSLGRAAVRSNVLPYHSRRSSEVSTSSSTDTPKAQERGSFDKQPFDPGYSPTSQMTTFTMPSPALSTDQKLFSNQPAIHAQQSTETNQRRSSAAGAPRDRFAASMPSLHQPVVHAQPRDRRTASNEEPGAQPSAIRLLIDSQKGRTTRDNDSIAEWISVSVNDLPLPDVTEAYGNGGAGEFSNENQHHGKKPKKNKPWKLGRFAASEVVLPSSSAVQAKRRSISLVKRSSSAQVNEPTRVSAESTSSPPSAPFMRNLGFTTANRNVALQNLCAERSVMALAASTIYIAGCGRIKVPQPAALPAAKSKAKSKTQEAENKKLGQVSTESTAVAVVEGPSSPVHPSHSADASQDAYLNVTEDRHTGYDLSGAAVGTVKSMVPELGDWSGSMEHDRSHSEEVAEPERPFRDYDDEGSDLFDSDRSDTESEDEFDHGEEDVEVPVRFGQRVNVSSRAGSAFYGSSVPTGYEAERSVDEATPPARPLVPSVSLDRLTPGTVMVHGTELRICVEEEQLSGRSARPMAYWKAVEVQQPESKPEEPVENQIRRQPSNRAMKLEEEVATGIFAAFVGNRSPRRQNQRASIDAGPCSADQGSPQKRSTQSTSISRRELVVSKVNKSTFTVRSETRSTMDGTEQVVEILRRGGSQSTHLTQASESSRGSTSTDKVERAFPSPLLSNTEFANSRPRSHNRTNGSLSTLEDVAERITIRIQQQGVSGFSASFQSRDGQVWLWQGSKLEASVLSPRKTQAGVHGIDVLDNYDLVLRARNGSQSIELATYSTDSQLRNALGLFKPRTKPVPKALPEDTSNLGSAVAPPTRVLPLAIPIRGMAGGISRGEPQIPLRGIRGGPLLRPQTSANGSALRQHGLWQQQRAAVSTEAVVQVHNNAVNNARASVQLNERLASKRASTDTARPSPQDEGTQDQKMGVLSFAAVEALDRDLVVLSLLAVMGSVRM